MQRIEVAAPRIGVVMGFKSWLVISLASVIGLLALTWPLVWPPQATVPDQSAQAPWVFALLMPVVILLALTQVTEGGMDSRSLALLGVLSAINAALRPALGAGTAGIESVFFLLILAGRVFGPGFGFLLGCTSLFASALLTAGIGPWLPFQMLCAAWVGLGAGLLPKRLGPRAELAVLIVYGIISAYAYGIAMNMWFWPFISGTHVEGLDAGSLDFLPGAPLAENLVRFAWFTLLTSTAGWDTGRALTNTVALLVLGRALLLVLRRASGMARVVPPDHSPPIDTIRPERTTT